MAWNDLTIAQRSQLMNLMRHNGITSISEMRRIYDNSAPSSFLVETTPKTSAPMYGNGGRKFGPGGDKSISFAQLLMAAKKWYENPENKKKLAFKLGAAAKEGAGLSPTQILMALANPQKPEYDELEAYLYGPEKMYEPYVGTSRGPLTEDEYKGIPQYRAELNPRGEYVVSKDLKPTILEAAKRGANIYINADDIYDPGSVRFDAANHPVKFRYQNDRLVADAADLYDFDEGYVDRYSEKNNFLKKAILRKEIRAMQSVGTPYIVRQEGIPVRFAGEGESEDPWVDDMVARDFEEAFMRGETGERYNWKGAINNARKRFGLPPIEFGSGGHKIHIKKANRGKFTALKKKDRTLSKLVQGSRNTCPEENGSVRTE